MSVTAPTQAPATNPLREGLEQERVPDASCLVIFGASGDLTGRKLLPALYSLAHDGLLPAGQTIIGFARPDFTDDAFRMAMREACDKYARTRPVDDAIWENFAKGLFYVQGDFSEPSGYYRLNQKLQECDRTRGTGGRRIYYLAVPPQFFPVISELLGAEKMVTDPERGGPFTRVIIEKPFGHDLQSAKELNRVAVSTFRERQVVRGHYADGSAVGEKAVAYRKEPNVSPDSKTETFAAMKVFVDNWRWADVPFYIRAGKRLPKRVTDISIHFRPAPYPMWRKLRGVQTQPNVLAIRIQPDEGISLKFDSKVPGPSIRTAPVTMEFRYATSFGAEPPEAYERLLLETMLGDSTLFARRDEVETAWAWLDPLLSAWAADSRPPDSYPAGTWGPEAADQLIERDGRKWRRP